MNTKKYSEKMKSLSDKMKSLTDEYIASNKKYNVGDVIRGKVNDLNRTILVERVDVEFLGDKPHIFYYGKAVRKGTKFYSDNHCEFIFQNEVTSKVNSHLAR
jgi:hypothetical protein